MFFFFKLFKHSKYLIICPNYKKNLIGKFRKLYHFPNKEMTNKIKKFNSTIWKINISQFEKLLNILCIQMISEK